MHGLTYGLHGNTKKLKDAPAVNWQSILTVLSEVLVGHDTFATTIKDNFKEEIKKAMKKVLILHHSIDYQDSFFEKLKE